MPKVILISGGSDGLGKTIAKLLSPKEKVIILAHNKEKVETASKEIGCDYVVAELTDYASLESAVKQVIDKYHTIDVLVNNAGIWTGGPLTEIPPEKIKEVIEVNTTGTIYLTKVVLPYLISQKTGQIINIISRDGLRAKADRSVYTASKWAITGFTKCLQEDLDESDIRITGIYPGPIKTSLFVKDGVNRDLSHAMDPMQVATLVETVINLSPDTRIPGIEITNKKTKNMDDTNAPVIDLNIDPDMITPQGDSPQPAQKPATPPVSNPGLIDITPGSKPIPSAPVSTNINTAPPLTPKIENITPPPAPMSAPVNVNPILTTPAPTQTPMETKPQSPLAEDPDLVKLVK